MAALDFSGPWGTTTEDATDFFQDDWRRLTRSDGVLNDTTGNSFKGSATGANTTVTVTGGDCRVQGFFGRDADSESFDVALSGTQPTSGQTRIDLIVLRMDPATKAVSRVLIPGTPATSGATQPSLTRSASGVWDMPILRITRGPGPVAVTQAMLTDLRSHVGPWLGFMPSSTDVTTVHADAPLGSLAMVGTDLWVRRLVSTTPTWTNVTTPTWTAATLASGIVSRGVLPVAYGVVGGRCWLTGIAGRTGGAAFAAGWTTLTTLPAGFRPVTGEVRAPVGYGATSLGGEKPMLEVSQAGVVRVFVEMATQNAVYLDDVSFRVI